MHHVTIIDVANVVGCRPDGWWRDRQGATARILDAVGRWSISGRKLTAAAVGTRPGDARAPEGFSAWCLIEGQAAAGTYSTAATIVRAATTGDDAIVLLARELCEPTAEPGADALDVTVDVVTSDRGLMRRLPPGCGHLSAGRLRTQLDAYLR